MVKSLSCVTTALILSLSSATMPVLAVNSPLQIAATMNNLTGTSWKLIGFRQKRQLTPVLPDTEITLDLTSDRFSGSGGCNRYMGGYEVKNQTFKPSAIASTRKACPEAIMNQELQYFNFLGKTTAYTLNSQGQLELTSPEGVLIFASQMAVNDPKSWLDSEKPKNWNKPGATLPKAPFVEGGGNLKECQTSIRKPSTPEDEALVKAGWSLFGPIQVYGKTSLRSAMANADGMCRPMEYQVFVFVGGQFAGTLSPVNMASRSEGSAFQSNITEENTINAIFNRYQPQDALCCPSGSSFVTYILEQHQGKPVVVPMNVSTSEK